MANTFQGGIGGLRLTGVTVLGRDDRLPPVVVKGLPDVEGFLSGFNGNDLSFFGALGLILLVGRTRHE